MRSTTGNQPVRDIDTAQIEERRFPPPPRTSARRSTSGASWSSGRVCPPPLRTSM